MQFLKSEFQLRCVDLGAFMRPGVLNGDSGGDGKRFGQAEMLCREDTTCIRSKGKNSKNAARSNQRDAEPRLHTFERSRISPFGLGAGVWQE